MTEMSPKFGNLIPGGTLIRDNIVKGNQTSGTNHFSVSQIVGFNHFKRMIPVNKEKINLPAMKNFFDAAQRRGCGRFSVDQSDFDAVTAKPPEQPSIADISVNADVQSKCFRNNITKFEGCAAIACANFDNDTDLAANQFQQGGDFALYLAACHTFGGVLSRTENDPSKCF